MLGKCSILAAVAALVLIVISTSAISQITRERAFPTDRTHATPEMVAAHPALF